MINKKSRRPNGYFPLTQAAPFSLFIDYFFALPKRRSRYKNRLMKSRYSCRAENMDARANIA